MTLQEAEKLIGKRVILKNQIICEKKYKEVGGTLQFVGFNKFLKGAGMQVTIDRMPFFNVDLNDLEEMKLTPNNNL